MKKTFYIEDILRPDTPTTTNNNNNNRNCNAHNNALHVQPQIIDLTSDTPSPCSVIVLSDDEDNAGDNMNGDDEILFLEEVGEMLNTFLIRILWII